MFTCILCGTVHTFTPYVLAHRFEHFATTCTCGARYDIYDGEATLVETTEARPTNWIEGAEPVHKGYYTIRFPNGTVSDRNWYWDGCVFRYDRDSPALLAFNCINAWRGLTRPAQ